MRTSDIEEFLFANDDDEEKDELDKFCFVDENPDLTKLQATVVGIRLLLTSVLFFVHLFLSHHQLAMKRRLRSMTRNKYK